MKLEPHEIVFHKSLWFRVDDGIGYVPLELCDILWKMRINTVELLIRFLETSPASIVAETDWNFRELQWFISEIQYHLPDSFDNTFKNILETLD